MQPGCWEVRVVKIDLVKCIRAASAGRALRSEELYRAFDHAEFRTVVAARGMNTLGRPDIAIQILAFKIEKRVQVDQLPRLPREAHRHVSVCFVTDTGVVDNVP
ncbi:hypothetical protein Pgy4_25945 [Pseudomonas savastanoi pv. glycinea str. race 4]|uniref:Uncharacterized protein n=1 Tax=Pseudomonas savastanoi pv. glycinea str. race 4 TaxID=875330 RepID=F3CB53_PSESG|nr:hypothetical protein Pgy4_25945 [Pseudomonas savastanoi pv. glycinea str. race 4]